MDNRTWIKLGGVGAAIAGEAFVIGALLPVGLAGAQDDESDAPTTQECTLTDEQRDALRADRAEHREEHRAERQETMEEVAGILGMTVDEIQEALRSGQTLADIAGDSVDEVIDALVAAGEARIDERLAAGDIDEERATEMKGNLEERVTDFVNGEGPRRGPRFGHRAPRRGMFSEEMPAEAPAETS
jgi:hypothetical protein